MKSFCIYTLTLFLLVASGSSFGQKPPLGPGRKYTTVERMHIDRLRAVGKDRLRYKNARREVGLRTGYRDYRAILHAHAEDSPHTGGTRAEMLADAKRAGVQIIMLTDHVNPERDFINDSWRGLRDGVLFIPGAEHKGFLAYPTASIRGKESAERDDFIHTVKEGGGNIFLSHVEEKLDWATDGLDGLEIYNHHTDIKDETQFNLWLRTAFMDPERLRQIERSLSEYPQEVIGAQQDYLTEIIAKWDRDARLHRLTGIAANDCHHNQVFTITAADDNSIEIGYISSRPRTTRVNADQSAGVAALLKGRKSGELIARLDFDPYERSMNYVTTHILAEQLTESAVRNALRLGHAYVSHDWLCDPTGFAFTAHGGGTKPIGVMGDEVTLSQGLKLKCATAVACTMKLFHNGAEIKTIEGDQMEFEPRAKGVYRIEVWLTVDGEQRPWIYSNHIYVR